MASNPSDVSKSEELPELDLPPSVLPLEPLPDETVLGPTESIVVHGLRGVRGRINEYLATFKIATGEEKTVLLREGPLDQSELEREAQVLGEVQYSMLPTLYGAFQESDRRYVAVDLVEGSTLEEALSQGLPPEQVASIVLQLAQVVRRLQNSGWSVTAITPRDVYVGQPLRLGRPGACVRLGAPEEQPPFVAGFTAPEVAGGAPVTGKEAVYSLGAVLYRGLASEPLPESGVEIATLGQLVPIPGAPQLLSEALAPADQRVDLQAFYAQLVEFKKGLDTRRLQLEIACDTTIGLNPTRQVNEDACGCASLKKAGSIGADESAVLCVVDGMGGMEAGEVASRAALHAVIKMGVDSVSAGIDGGGSQSEPITPRRLVQAAARAVIDAAAGRQVGATITCAIIDNGSLTIGHVGDTRAYLLRDGTMSQLTRDHSLVAAMVANGMISPEEARGHPDSNKVLRSLGGQRELPDEFIDDLSVTQGMPQLRLQDGDTLLFCSDGVWGPLDDDGLQESILAAADCASGVRSIITAVLKAGAPDNASVIMARCHAATAV
jgi:protein phosphatase